LLLLSVIASRADLCYADVATLYSVDVMMLQAPDVKQAAASELGKELHRAYAKVCHATKPHQQLQQSIEHTPDQVRTILGIM